MELWDLYDKRLEKLGKTIERGGKTAFGEDELHMVVHVWLMNSEGRLLVQKRAAIKKESPNEWSTTGGSAIAGEDGIAATIRETQEELGIALKPAQLSFVMSYARRHDFVMVYFASCDVPAEAMRLQEIEVAKAEYWTVEEVEARMTDGSFWNYRYWQLLKQYFQENGLLKSK
ncbi:MAG: NUDIX domain-containing protein [Eubacteriales bacterium]|nr:NUDIX domain-containing protein [Eubacteriales bacterium]MDD3881436.1 NUDIX domain-containing protein [Eubacteriales bacterium]